MLRSAVNRLTRLVTTGRPLPERPGSIRRRSHHPALEPLEGRSLLSLVPPINAIPQAITAGPDGALWFTETADPGYDQSVGRVTTSGAFSTFSDGIPLGYTPIGITSGPDGSLWFAQASGQTNRFAEIGRITPSGAITEFPLRNQVVSTQILRDGTIFQSQGTPNWIASGSDGALWFTLNATGQVGDATTARIGRIDTSGNDTYFSQGLTAGIAFHGITAGPDGALWFADSNGVGRISTAGAITLYNQGLPPNASALGITSGPDGALWFTLSTGQIGRISTAGAISLFASGLPAGSLPRGITNGPDGALWFTSSAGGEIGRITTAGAVSLFPLPQTPGVTQLYGITAGPDGALWFTGTVTQSITDPITPAAKSGHAKRPAEINVIAGIVGRITPQGDVTLYPAPTPGYAPVTVSSVYRMKAGGTQSIVIQFLAPLNPTDAANVRNYQLTRRTPARHNRQARPRPIVSAVYNPAALTVTLTTRQPLDPNSRLTLRIFASGLHDTLGRELYGNNREPSDFVGPA